MNTSEKTGIQGIYRLYPNLIIPIILVFCIISPAFPQAQKILCMTYNIRYDNPDDGINSWPFRKIKVTEMIMEQDPDIIGIQEALDHQVTTLGTLLKSYKWFGVGRDDGKKSGEYALIMYKKNKLSIIDSGYFWLSQTPDIPGKGWDAACIRIVTWVKLKYNRSGKEFYFFNTHFDHISEKARLESAKLMIRRMKKIAGDSPVILCGDFNSTKGSMAYQWITNNDEDYNFLDTRMVCNERPEGPEFSYAGFEPGKINGELIDFIFVRNIQSVSNSKIKDKIVDGYYPSDHFPVSSVVNF